MKGSLSPGHAPSPLAETRRIIPCLAGRRPYHSYRTIPLRDGRGELACEVSCAPQLLQQQMLAKAQRAFAAIAGVPDEQWFAAFHRAALLLSREGFGDIPGITALASAVTGVPVVRVRKALQTLADHLSQIEHLLASQSPTGSYSAFRDGGGQEGWRWTPEGRTVAVRVPGNFPTINVNWLLALAARRPVLVCAATADPVTPHYLAEVLYRSGVPDGAISLCFDQAEFLFEAADQVLWPGEPPPVVTRRHQCRLRVYHQGRSKLLMLEADLEPAMWCRLAILVMQGCGRLCTNPSGILVEDNAMRTAVKLAEALGNYAVLPLDAPDAQLAAFIDPNRADAIARLIEQATRRGAVDVSLQVTGRALCLQRGGLTYLRPTVLVVARDDPLFGHEFPFPFVTISDVPRREMPRYARNSLIVSLIGDDPRLRQELLLDPTIDKLFEGDHFDRGYQPTDPHQGFIADFLFRKKAVFTGPTRAL